MFLKPGRDSVPYTGGKPMRCVFVQDEGQFYRHPLLVGFEFTLELCDAFSVEMFVPPADLNRYRPWKESAKIVAPAS